VFCFDQVRIPGGGAAGAATARPGRWVDPPLASAYEYTMLGGAHCTAIADFPTGFAAPFSVIADGTPVPGTFGPGDTLEFPAPGVTSFVVMGIQPGTDSTRGYAFPLRIATDEEIVSFEVRALIDQTEVGATAKKLSLTDRRGTSGRAKLKFLAKDAALTKGTATDPSDIAASLSVKYEGGAAAGSFAVPRGVRDASGGWSANTATNARYGNKLAPLGPTQAKAVTLKPGKTFKLVAAGVGDVPFDIVAAGPPPGRVLTALCVENGADAVCHCSAFSDCVHKPQSGGASLKCKDAVPDSACEALR
jgi:hypothetical protein